MVKPTTVDHNYAQDMKTILLLLFLFATVHYTKCQNIDELIKSQKENLSDLYLLREIPASWIESGNVTKDDINRVLNEYYLNVGLIIYNYHEDTLQTILIDKKNTIDTSNYIVKEKVLIEEIENANKWFSSAYLSRGPSKRGAKPSSSVDNSIKYRESYEHISKILLPFNDKVFKKFDHLIIVPALNISILPFSALKLSNEEYLIDAMSYSIAPSLYEFMVYNLINEHLQTNRIDEETPYNFKNALFIANPAFPKNPLWHFPGLPGTEKEVNYLTNKLEPKNYTKLIGKDAVLTNFKDQMCNFDLLYFATHGITDINNPLDSSFLVLADHKENSYLTAREIQNIRYTCSLNADLVILSACQTGLGKAHTAGLIGIARAFQIAGAKHVLMSLWNISDDETATLMGLFFDNLLKGGALMPHEALRQAILTYKSNYNNNPNYWAAFSIFGMPY